MRALTLILFAIVVLVGAAAAQQPVVITGSRSANFVMQNAAAAGNGTTVNVTGLTGMRVTVNCAGAGANIAVTFQAQNDGTNFGPVAIIRSDAAATAPTGVTTCAGPGITNWYIPIGGYLGLRAAITGGATGTVTVTATAVPLGDTPPIANVTQVSGAGLTSGQVTVANTATLIVAARSGRVRVTIQNLGTTVIYLGGSTVTTANGFRLMGLDGASYTTLSSAAIYGIVAAGTQPVSFIEEY